jgi:hypothetical protein
VSAAVWLAGGRLEVAGECSPELAERIAGGQPVVLILAGRPVAVVLDVDSWAEVEQVDEAHGDCRMTDDGGPDGVACSPACLRGRGCGPGCAYPERRAALG